MMNLKIVGNLKAVLIVTGVMAVQAGAANAVELGPAGGQGGSIQASQCIQDRVVVGVKVRVGGLVDRVEAVRHSLTE